uniref:Uncharacterized protein n=1 Tax=Molossus molossus TaxID=27622 RepID=A0A7J8JWP1_MOLMO|nr:hypothetical protein HJG59_007791 [Molossus molossus]
MEDPQVDRGSQMESHCQTDLLIFLKLVSESVEFVLLTLHGPESALGVTHRYHAGRLQPCSASTELLVLPSCQEFPAFVFTFSSYFCLQVKSMISLSLSVNVSAYSGHLLPYITGEMKTSPVRVVGGLACGGSTG